jgi:hypothetical protein
MFRGNLAKTQGDMRESVGTTKKFPKRNFFICTFGSDISCNEPSTEPQKLWRQDQVDNLLSHLKSCDLQPANIKAAASEEHGKHKRGTKHQKQIVLLLLQALAPLSFAPDPFAPGPSSLLHPGLTPEQHFSFTKTSAWLEHELGSEELYSLAGSVGPSDSISQIGHSCQPSFHSSSSDISASSSTGSKIRRVTSQLGVPSSLAWPEGQQVTFERALARITASAGFSLSWIENPELVGFFQMFLPQGNLPS